jgi:hypothetical protein
MSVITLRRSSVGNSGKMVKEVNSAIAREIFTVWASVKETKVNRGIEDDG